MSKISRLIRTLEVKDKRTIGLTIEVLKKINDDLNNLQTQLDAKGVLDDVVEDTTPQLGGDLDTNGNNITGNPEIDGRRSVVSQATTSRTLSLTDAGCFINCSNGAATTITIPTNATVAFPLGTEIDIFFHADAGVVEADTGVTLNGVSAGSTTITSVYAGCTIKKIKNDEWIIVGKINTVA